MIAVLCLVLKEEATSIAHRVVMSETSSHDQCIPAIAVEVVIRMYVTPVTKMRDCARAHSPISAVYYIAASVNKYL